MFDTSSSSAAPEARPSDVDVDVAIIGAGVSGIGIACHVRNDHPGRRIAILERRDAIGGTWDLFRYPGIRSDSDMYTFGYSLNPWPLDDVLTDGETIRSYVVDTAEKYGVDRDIRFGTHVQHVSWSSADQRWTITATKGGEDTSLTARFLVSCTGYYDYDRAHRPAFEGEDSFRGTIVHPQFWPEDLDHGGKRVVVIGSGATAITLVPAMAETAAHVTMLQRSPTYVVNLPSTDPIAPALKKVLPLGVVSAFTRIRNLGIQMGIYEASRRAPALVRRALLGQARRQLRGAVDMEHFTPHYDPWDERLCAVPDGDLFRALRSDSADVVTGHIARFTETGIELTDGRHLDADVIVTATGLQIKILGGITADVDGETMNVADALTYRAVMVDRVPNFALVVGYINVSWTRKVDHVGRWLSRVFDAMDRRGAVVVTPDAKGAPISDEPFMDMTSGYMERARHLMPRQGERNPWRNSRNVLRDWFTAVFAPVDDGNLVFDQPVPADAAVDLPELVDVDRSA